MNRVQEWIARWVLPEQQAEALADLQIRLMPDPVHEYSADELRKSEAYATSVIRIEAGKRRVLMMRNNVGALQDAQGRWVRYGLMNESRQLNERIKSADWIALESFTVTPLMVGMRLARPLSIEVKHPGWRPGEDPEREGAQFAWQVLWESFGGRAVFATGPNDVW